MLRRWQTATETPLHQALYETPAQIQLRIAHSAMAQKGWAALRRNGTGFHGLRHTYSPDIARRKDRSSFSASSIFSRNSVSPRRLSSAVHGTRFIACTAASSSLDKLFLGLFSAGAIHSIAESMVPSSRKKWSFATGSLRIVRSFRRSARGRQGTSARKRRYGKHVTGHLRIGIEQSPPIAGPSIGAPVRQEASAKEVLWLAYPRSPRLLEWHAHSRAHPGAVSPRDSWTPACDGLAAQVLSQVSRAPELR